MQIQYTQYLDMMNQWLILKQEGKSIAGYLNRKQYQSIAVYGMSIYGRHVIRELRGTDIEIKYGIDRKVMKPYEGICVLQPLCQLPPVDIVICTVLHDLEGIRKALADLIDSPVVSLEEVVFESYG